MCPLAIDDGVIDTWRDSLVDPCREDVFAAGAPDLGRILTMFPRPAGDAAFDGDIIAGNLQRLTTVPEVDTGHPLLDLSVKTGLAFTDATFQGDHPKYGVKIYGRNEHDPFPPTIIAVVDALSAWGQHARAKRLFHYWLLALVNADGTVRYRGTSIAEYGQLLHTASVLEERTGADGWWEECRAVLERIADHLLRLRSETAGGDGLLVGCPEDDERDKPGKYFHNNAWAAKGLLRWAALCERLDFMPSASPDTCRDVSAALQRDLLAAVRQTWPDDPDDWWLPPQLEPLPRPECLTATREASYTNYRYWPELLSSGVLPPDLADRIVNARLRGGGQFCGMTRFLDRLDDWPLADYLYALWDLGRKDDFLFSLFGHVVYHQAEGHLTAYEQISFPPGREVAPYCMPCQLVAARAARLLVE